eukprot:TRINITY_DN104623_c0_g1_i1.p1 TRINITY_DN104623_c0_g1~~TRINITY_DN104623_c0_g1_i1.p1  ORF type:complete len:747 (+),score=107.94 TRINITY_DN104623_c0_g1_i1:42-2243(+)
MVLPQGVTERERELSPTRGMYDIKKEMQAKVDGMINVGLHPYDPAWNDVWMNAGTYRNSNGSLKNMHGPNKPFSASFKECTLTIMGTDETMKVPVQTCTRVSDVKKTLSARLMVPENSLSFVVKNGCSWKTQDDSAEIGRRVIVKGLQSFKPLPSAWPHPTAIIGAGYNGMKAALLWLQTGRTDFMMFDRYDKVGGHAWLVQANKTSKLQTEFAAFHVWFGAPFLQTNGGKLDYPSDWSTWPKRDEVNYHFQHAAERYGLLPYIRFKTEVTHIDILGTLKDPERSYALTTKALTAKGEQDQLMFSHIMHYPGAYFNPRIINYPGEDTFGGQIGYGMNDDIPYDHLQGKVTAILGNGAFAVENIRTCVEYGGTKVYLITRRKNLALPRLCCWFCHQGLAPTPASMLLDIMNPMYELCNFGDPWSFHSVYGSKEKNMCTIKSNSRFGIGDITFLAVAVGLCEYYVDLLKRCSPRTLHLEGGRKLEGVDNIIKALGLIADFEADRMHKMKKSVGIWPENDDRRFIYADPIGMNASNFTTHSTGGGSYSATQLTKYFIDFPAEMRRFKGDGYDRVLPTNVAQDERPAHQWDSKYYMNCMFMIIPLFPGLIARMSDTDNYMWALYQVVNPYDKFYEECLNSWNQYQDEFRKMGHKFEYVPYPYTKDMVDGWFKEYNEKHGPLSIEEQATWAPADPKAAAGKEVHIKPVQYDKAGENRQFWKDMGILYEGKSSSEEELK